MRRVSIPLAVIALAAGGVAAGTAAEAKTRNCHVRPVNDTTAILSAKNMSCQAARRALRRYKGPYTKHFTTPGGFKCSRTYSSSGGLVQGWRCKKGRKSFRVGFGD
jgi:hypothetical protein